MELSRSQMLAWYLATCIMMSLSAVDFDYNDVSVSRSVRASSELNLGKVNSFKTNAVFARLDAFMSDYELIDDECQQYPPEFPDVKFNDTIVDVSRNSDESMPCPDFLKELYPVPEESCALPEPCIDDSVCSILKDSFDEGTLDPFILWNRQRCLPLYPSPISLIRRFLSHALMSPRFLSHALMSLRFLSHALMNLRSLSHALMSPYFLSHALILMSPHLSHALMSPLLS